ncbi:MAG: FG-GAP-like repeat-containing protein [bacterium]|nr:FG-GAP-like repeat-containing protein [bacterium]
MKRCMIFLAVVLLCGLFSAPHAQPDAATSPCLIYGPSGIPIPNSGSPCYPCSADQSWTPSSPTDDIEMHQIGTVAGPLYYAMVGGDSDMDGHFEAYMYIRDNQGSQATFTYRIYENDGQNNYPEMFQSETAIIPYGYGDTDADSLPEVVGQWSSYLRVYESPAPGRLATQMIWQSPALYNVTGYTAIGDLDQDGHGEIIHTQNSFGSDNRLVIYESTGNNQFQEIYNQQVSTGNLGSKALADFDGDGLQEVAFSSGNGDVYVYESTGNNTIAQTFHGTMNTYNAYACSFANDMDGNGRPEFICGGSDSNRGWITQIYEATGNNQFAVRQEIVIWDGYFGVPGNTVGDFDGDGVDEFVIQLAQGLRLYKWDGQQYSPDGTIPENFGYIQHGVVSYDGNNNGYDDIFWLGLGDSGYWTNLTINLEDVTAATPPDVTIALTPVNPPIVLPPTGGSFSYNVNVHNADSTAAICDVWVLIQLPDSSWYGPVFQVNNRSLPAGMTASRNRNQVVPGNAPVGTYYMVGYIGDYPNTIWGQSSFGFTKSGVGDGAGGDWISYGEDFDNFDVTQPSQPTEFRLEQNYPNPFNPTTTIRFMLPEAAQVRLEVFGIDGRLVRAQHAAPLPAGEHNITFDGSGLAAGIYLYRLEAGSHTAGGKMVLLK